MVNWRRRQAGRASRDEFLYYRLQSDCSHDPLSTMARVPLLYNGRRENCTKLMNTVVHRVSSITITNVHRRPWPATRWAFVVQRPVSRGVISFKNWGYELDLCSWFHLPSEMTVWLIRFVAAFNPLMGTGNYSATSNNMMLVHWPLMGRLLH